MKKRTDNILAEGEATGHCHAAEGVDVAVYGDGPDRLLDVPDGAEITHQEHENFTVPAGKFRTGIVREQDHFADEARHVVD